MCPGEKRAGVPEESIAVEVRGRWCDGEQEGIVTHSSERISTVFTVTSIKTTLIAAYCCMVRSYVNYFGK